MKILIVSIADIRGGAARSAYRVHKSLLDNEIDSQMLVNYKFSNENTINYFCNKKIYRIFNYIRFKFDVLPIKFYFSKTKTLFSTSLVPFSGVVDRINKINPDIVHLHWICEAMIPIIDIKKIKSPIVWSLHDMWPFTGGCHYDENCGAYKKYCCNCKVLNSKKNIDLSTIVFNVKSKIFSKISSITLVGMSRWICDCAQESSLFKNRKIINIPTPIDINIFSPLDKNMSRKNLGLPQDKKLIFFGAMSATIDPRKGFDKLKDSLKYVSRNNVEIVIFGNDVGQKESPDIFNFKTHYLGNLNEDNKIRELYSAADVMIVPSLQENLSNAIMESLACSTPVVAFDIGGNSDMIEHKKNGYLAKPFDADDLANGINWVLDCENYNELCSNAREKVLREFDSKIVAKKYIELYKSILDDKFYGHQDINNHPIV